jgi:hypothetical protein
MNHIDINEFDVNNVIAKPVEVKKVSSNQTVSYKVLPIRYELPDRKSSLLLLELPKLHAHEGIKQTEFGGKISYSYSSKLFPDNPEHALVINKMAGLYDKLCDFVIQNKKDLGLSASYRKELLPTIMKELIYMPKDKETGDYSPDKTHYLNIKLQERSMFMDLREKVITKEKLMKCAFTHTTVVMITGIMLVSGKLFIKMNCTSSVITKLEPIKSYFPQMKTIEKYRNNGEVMENLVGDDEQQDEEISVFE